MTNSITNTQNSSNVAYIARPISPSSAQPTSSLEVRETLSDLTSAGKLFLAQRCPPEIWLNIFNWLPFEDKKQASLVCQDWAGQAGKVIKIVVAVKTSEELKSALNSFRPGRESHLKFDSEFEFPSNWENMEPNEGVESLDIRCSIKLTDEKLPTLLEKFPNLKELQLSYCTSLKFDSVDKWPTLKHVKKLDLSMNHELTANKLAALLKKFPNLEMIKVVVTVKTSEELKVALNSFRLSGELHLKFDSKFEFSPNWENMKPNAGIESLDIRWSVKLTDEELPTLLEKFPDLKELQLSYCTSLKFDSVDKWPALKHVKKLDLSMNDQLTDNKLAALLEKFPDLEELQLYKCSNLEFNSVDKWPTLKHVKKLNLSINKKLTDDKLAALLERFPNLEELDLSNCTHLKFNSMHEWPALKHVKKLNLSGHGENLTSKKLIALLQKFPNLEELDLSDCTHLKFNSMHEWPAFNYVKKLNLSGHGENLTSEKLIALLQKFPNLEELDLRYCEYLEFDSIYKWPALKNLKKIRGDYFTAEVINALSAKYLNLRHILSISL